MIYFLILTIPFQGIQDKYYDDAAPEVASLQVDLLPYEGDSLYWAINYISRANYKIGNYRRAHRLASRIPLDSVRHRFLYFDVLQLRALTAKNNGYFELAEFYYDRLFAEIPEGYDPIKYRAYLNRAELRRIKMDYRGRRSDLEKAIKYSDEDKPLRVLARHYIDVELRFDKARTIMRGHTSYDSLSGQDKAGYELLMAQLAEAEHRYDDARYYYKKAARTATATSFFTYARQAADGWMRSVNLEIIRNRNIRNNIVKIIAGALIIAILSYWHARRNERMA